MISINIILNENGKRVPKLSIDRKYERTRQRCIFRSESLDRKRFERRDSNDRNFGRLRSRSDDYPYFRERSPIHYSTRRSSSRYYQSRSTIFRNSSRSRYTRDFESSRDPDVSMVFEDLSRRPTHRGIRSDVRIRESRDLAKTRRQIAALSIRSDSVPKNDGNGDSAEVRRPTNTQLIKDPIFLFTDLRKTLTPKDPPDTSTKTTVVHETTKPTPPTPAPDNPQLSKALLEAYRCSQCSGFSVPEYYECPGGHSVCEECWLLLSYCSLCPNSPNFRRVRSMERLLALELIKFPCQWRGCTESLTAKAWREHVAGCSRQSSRGEEKDRRVAVPVFGETGSADDGYFYDSSLGSSEE